MDDDDDSTTADSQGKDELFSQWRDLARCSNLDKSTKLQDKYFQCLEQ